MHSTISNVVIYNPTGSGLPQLAPDLVNSLAEMAKDYADKKRSIVLSIATDSAKDELLILLCLSERGASWNKKPGDPDLPTFTSHEWLEGDEDTSANREAYMAHLKRHVKLDTNYSFVDVQPKRTLLSVTVKGSDGDRSIRGTTDVVVAKLSDAKNDTIRNGVEALLELKKPEKLKRKDNGPQTIAEHLAASALNPSVGVVSFLTDLTTSWTVFWFGWNGDGTEVILYKLKLEGQKGAQQAFYMLESLKDESRRELLPTTFSDRLSFNDLSHKIITDRNNPKRQRMSPGSGSGGGSLEKDAKQPPNPGQRPPPSGPTGDSGNLSRSQPQGGQADNSKGAQLTVMDSVTVLRHFAPQYNDDIADELDLVDMVNEAEQHEIIRSFAMKHIVPHMTGHYPSSTC